MNETRGKSEDQTLRTREERLAETLSLPRDLVLGAPVLTCVGSMSVTVENHRGILEYGPERIRILGKNSRIRILGTGLVISYFNRDSLRIDGRIGEIQYE